MSYEKIILEMLERIKTLEIKVAELEKTVQNSHSHPDSVENVGKINITEGARQYIATKKKEARNDGLSDIVLLCNDIQKALGVMNRAPAVCSAMYDSMLDGDEVLYAPPSGKSTTVKIRYYV